MLYVCVSIIAVDNKLLHKAQILKCHRHHFLNTFTVMNYVIIYLFVCLCMGASICGGQRPEDFRISDTFRIQCSFP